MMRTRYRLYFPPCAALLMLGTGCLNPRINALQSRMDTLSRDQKLLRETLESQSLRSESVAVGLEKLGQRIDLVSPPSAQWMKLEKGATIKWFLAEIDQHVYLQFLERADQTGALKVAISSGARTSQHVLRPGEAVEHQWTVDSRTHLFIVTCHRLLIAEQGVAYAMFSITRGPLVGTG